MTFLLSFSAFGQSLDPSICNDNSDLTGKICQTYFAKIIIILDFRPIFNYNPCWGYIWLDFTHCVDLATGQDEIIVGNHLSETITITDKECGKIYEDFINNADDYQKNLFLLKFEEIMQKNLRDLAIDRLLASRPDIVQRLTCGTGNYMNFTYKYGPCARHCLGTKKVKTGENQFEYQITKTNIYCGGVCCESKQKLCLKEVSPGKFEYVAIGDKNYTSISSCETLGDPSIIECGNSFGVDPEIEWIVTSECKSICAEKSGILDKKQLNNTAETVSYFNNEKIINSNNIKILNDNYNALIEFVKPFEGKITLLDVNGKEISKQYNQLGNKIAHLV